jgi:hypothetical protein
MLAKSFDANGLGHANIFFISHNNLYSLSFRTTGDVPYNEDAYLTLARTVSTYIDNRGGPADG